MFQIVNYVGEFGEDWLHVTEIFCNEICCNAGKVNRSYIAKCINLIIFPHRKRRMSNFVAKSLSLSSINIG